MNMLTKATTLAVSILALTGTAYAATPSSSGSSQWPSFSQLDKNSDGVIEKKEAKQAKGLNFKEADSDSDGKVSQSEYQTAMLKNGHGGAGSDSGMGSSGSTPGSTGSTAPSSGSPGSSSDPAGSAGSTSGTYR